MLLLLSIGLVFAEPVLRPYGSATNTAFAQSAGEIIRPAPGNSKNFNPFRSLFRMLGSDDKRQKKRTNRSSSRPARAATAAPAFVELPKDPDAGVVLVLGDRMARGMAEGLSFTLAEKPMVRIERVSEDRSGLLSGDASPWPQRALAKIRGDNVRAVVIMMGQNDLGRAIPADPPVEFATPEWWSAYEDQVEELVAAIRAERKPIVWVGLPPTGSSTRNQDFSQLNDLFKASAEEQQGYFVDIWEIFLSEEGEYSSFGPDVDGKRRRLRTSDKTGFTWAGYRKVAFFVERQLSRVLGGYGGFAFEGVEDDPNFIVLTGRTTSPENVLLGGEQPSELESGSAAYRFIVAGDPLPDMPGRVDFTGRLDQGITR